MEKYAVDTVRPNVKEKNAWDKGDCPWCGAPIEKKGESMYCPNDGTEPFEGKPKHGDKKR